MDAGHYKKTELEIISVSDLDGEIPEEPYGRNILREKTFNSELNLLVNKIFNNEKISEEPAPPAETDLIEKNLLLLECEKIIYQLKHSGDMESLSSYYNPFNTDIDVYDDIDDTADYIKSGLLQCGYSNFQILKYNFNDKAFRSDINLLDTSFSTDMYFSIKDPLILRIQEQDEGYILKPELIESDPFFFKKFKNKDAEKQNSGKFYIIRICSLFKDSMNKKPFENRINKFEEFLSPLLLIEIDSVENKKTEEIFELLKETAALPLMLYFLKNRIKFSFNNYSLEDTLLMTELFIKSAVNTKLNSYIMTLKDYSSKDNIFILKFLLAKIKKILNKDSLILRISINQAVLITSRNTDDIFDIIDRVNFNENIIDMQLIDYREYLSSKEFVNLFL